MKTKWRLDERVEIILTSKDRAYKIFTGHISIKNVETLLRILELNKQASKKEVNTKNEVWQFGKCSVRHQMKGSAIWYIESVKKCHFLEIKYEWIDKILSVAND